MKTRNLLTKIMMLVCLLSLNTNALDSASEASTDDTNQGTAELLTTSGAFVAGTFLLGGALLQEEKEALVEESNALLEEEIIEIGNASPLLLELLASATEENVEDLSEIQIKKILVSISTH